MNANAKQELEQKLTILFQLPNAEGALMPFLTEYIDVLTVEAYERGYKSALDNQILLNGVIKKDKPL